MFLPRSETGYIYTKKGIIVSRFSNMFRLVSNFVQRYNKFYNNQNYFGEKINNSLFCKQNRAIYCRKWKYNKRRPTK